MHSEPVGSVPLRRSLHAKRGGSYRRVLWVLGCGVLPAAVFLSVLLLAVGHRYAFDLHQFWQGANDVVHGRSPYPARSSLPSAAQAPSLTPLEVQQQLRFPYPAPAAVALAPFGALPFWAVATIFTFVLCGALALALRVLGVRDWRCYGLMFGSIAAIGAVRLGTFTPLLILALAVAWRYRDRSWISASVLAAAVVAKLFLWPVLVWLIATRRLRTAASSVALALGSVVVGWSVIGFAGLRDYPHLLSIYSRAGEAKGFSDVALGLALGLPGSTARALGLVLGAAALAAVFVAARRRDGDRCAFIVSIAASLLLTPIVWLHYFALLYVPVAVSRRRFGAAWLLPLVLWVSPFEESHGDAWRLVVVLACTAGVVGMSLLSGPRVARAQRTTPAIGREVPA